MKQRKHESSASSGVLASQCTWHLAPLPLPLSGCSPTTRTNAANLAPPWLLISALAYVKPAARGCMPLLVPLQLRINTCPLDGDTCGHNPVLQSQCCVSLLPRCFSSTLFTLLTSLPLRLPTSLGILQGLDTH